MRISGVAWILPAQLLETRAGKLPQQEVISKTAAHGYSSYETKSVLRRPMFVSTSTWVSLWRMGWVPDCRCSSQREMDYLVKNLPEAGDVIVSCSVVRLDSDSVGGAFIFGDSSREFKAV